MAKPSCMPIQSRMGSELGVCGRARILPPINSGNQIGGNLTRGMWNSLCVFFENLACNAGHSIWGDELYQRLAVLSKVEDWAPRSHSIVSWDAMQHSGLGLAGLLEIAEFDLVGSP